MDTRLRWIIVIGALLLAVGVGAIAYNAGLAQGIEQSGRVITTPPGAVHYYVGHRPWGFGFFIPLFFVAFWLLAFRAFRGHHRHACRYDEDHPRS